MLGLRLSGFSLLLSVISPCDSNDEMDDGLLVNSEVVFLSKLSNFLTTRIKTVQSNISILLNKKTVPGAFHRDKDTLYIERKVTGPANVNIFFNRDMAPKSSPMFDSG